MIQVSQEDLEVLRELYHKWIKIEMYDPVTCQKRYSSIEEMKDEKKLVISKYISEYPELVQLGIIIDTLPKNIENF